MSIEKGTSIKCSDYTKDIMETVSCKRRSKDKGISVDQKQLSQFETLLLCSYLIHKDNEVYEKIINIKFPKDLINKLTLFRRGDIING